LFACVCKVCETILVGSSKHKNIENLPRSEAAALESGRIDLTSDIAVKVWTHVPSG
jgi:hypothetical protein